MKIKYGNKRSRIHQKRVIFYACITLQEECGRGTTTESRRCGHQASPWAHGSITIFTLRRQCRTMTFPRRSWPGACSCCPGWDASRSRSAFRIFLAYFWDEDCGCKSPDFQKQKTYPSRRSRGSDTSAWRCCAASDGDRRCRDVEGGRFAWGVWRNLCDRAASSGQNFPGKHTRAQSRSGTRQLPISQPPWEISGVGF
jgi:hypothetical protein